MLFLHPSWNTVEGVYGLCESRGGKTPRHNESKSGWKAAKLAQPGADLSIWHFCHSEHKPYDPKDVWSKLGHGEVRRKSDGGHKHCWRTTRLCDLSLGAKYQSNHLRSGSLRSFPQNSWSLYVFPVVKRMIRGLGGEMPSTYSQTFNRGETRATW